METRKRHAANCLLSEDDAGYSSGFTPDSPETSLIITEDEAGPENSLLVSPKRGRVDEEGFVMPATPDIPINSIHHREARSSPEYIPREYQSPLNDAEERYREEQSGVTQSEDTYSESEEAFTVQPLSSGERRPTITPVTPPTMPQNDHIEQDGNGLESYIKGCSEVIGAAFQQCTQRFNNTETFEKMSIEGVNKLLMEAQNLEKRMLQKKSQYTQVIQQLSQTLRN